MSTVTRKDSPSTSSVTKGTSTSGSAPPEDAPSLDDVASPRTADAAASFEGNGKAKGADAQDAIRTIEGKLSEWHVSDADARQCVDELRKLSPADRALVWQAMGEESQTRLLDNLDGASRSRLLDSLGEAGVLKQVAATPHPKGTTGSSHLVSKDVWGSPPEGPTFHARNPDMPPALQKAVHEENLARAEQYRARYDDYLDAYKNEVVLPAAKNDDIASIRRAGPPGPLLLPEREPGAPLGAKGHGEVDRADAWRKVADPTQALADVYGPIVRAVHHARGEMMAGELRFLASASVKSGGIEVSHSVDIGQDGDANRAVKVKGKVDAGPVSVAANASEATLGGDIGPLGGSVTLKPDGEGGIQIGEVSASIGIARVGADLEKGTAKVGAGVDVGVVSGEVGVELKPFLGAREIEGLFRKDGGFFEVPPELAEGKAWRDLPEERRADLTEFFGWSEKEWASLSKRHAKLELNRQYG